MTNGSLMKVESIAECLFCNTFDPHLAITGSYKPIFGLLRVAVSHRFYCSMNCFGESQLETS